MARKRRFYGLIAWLAFIVALLFVLPSTGVFDNLPSEVADWLPTAKVQMGLDLEGGMMLRLEADMSNVPTGEQDETMGNIIEIIRRRVDEYGLAETEVEQTGATGITVRIPGIRDSAMAKDLIGERAVLEFMLVDPDAKALPEILKTVSLRPAYTELMTHVYDLGYGVFAPAEYAKRLEALADDTALRSLKPGYALAISTVETADANNRFGQKVAGDLSQLTGTAVESFYQLYLLDTRRPIQGADLTNAYFTRDSQMGQPAVGFEFNYTGSELFRQVTGSHINEQLAIVLDDRVISAPVIEDEISGNGIIKGNFSVERARDLAIKLRSGALPVPLSVVMEDTIGPSLGADSIKSGITAALIGLVLVMAFMIVWYKWSGVLSVIALVLNMMIIVAVLALFGATLTLPGIAGMILTIGMSVDANVLIFERIREELRKESNVSASTQGTTRQAFSIATAISNGYDKAFLTIFDANITTLITAAVLYFLGTGPIKGFAITLGIGIAASMFTAIMVTRAIFDWRLRRRRQLTHLSI